MVKLLLNGRPVEFLLDEQTPLLWALRDTANLTGTKYGCGKGLCGACTVLVDRVAARSCQTPIAVLGGAEVVTIEGLAEGARPHPVQQAFAELQLPQCGFCQSGMVLAAVALIEDSPEPTAADIAEQIGNLCRCGVYPRVAAAVRRAIELRQDAAANAAVAPSAAPAEPRSGGKDTPGGR